MKRKAPRHRSVTANAPLPAWDDNPIGQQDLLTMVRKALSLQFSVQGHVDPNVDLSTTVDDYTQQEFYVLRRGALCEWGTPQAPAALKVPTWQLVPAPGTLAVVREIRIVNTGVAANSYVWGFATPDGGETTAFPQQRDQRMRGKVSAIVPKFAVINGPSFPSGGRVTVAAGATVIVPVTYVLTASDATVFKVCGETVNFIGEAYMAWTERPLGPQEL